MTKNPITAKMFDIKSLPTIKLFMDGVEMAEYTGHRNAAAMFGWLAKMHTSSPPLKSVSDTESEYASFSRKVKTPDGEEVTKIDIAAFKAAQQARGSDDNKASEGLLQAPKSRQAASKQIELKGQTHIRTTRWGRWPTGQRPIIKPYVLDPLGIEMLKSLKGYTLDEFVLEKNPKKDEGVIQVDWVVNNPETGNKAKIVLGDDGLVELARVLDALPEGTILRRLDAVECHANSVESFRKIGKAIATVSKRVGLTEVHFERNHLVRETDRQS
eukprot:SAG31_NODE_1439_length_8332_cov_11.389166_6_plen_271_part_00